jgi:hypothetical protein
MIAAQNVGCGSFKGISHCVIVSKINAFTQPNLWLTRPGPCFDHGAP